MNKYRSLQSFQTKNDALIDYQHHMRRLNEIQKSNRNPISEPDNLKQLKTLQKWKQTVKTRDFGNNNSSRKKQNKHLLEKLWKISLEKPSHARQKTFDTTQINIKHRAISQKRFSQKVIEQNLILARNLINQSRSIKSKQKIKQQMAEYLNRKIQIRKTIAPQQVQKIKKQIRRSQSKKYFSTHISH